MLFFDHQQRDQLRLKYVEAWHKHRSNQPLQPLEAQIADVILMHPEYHCFFEDSEKLLDRNWTPEDGTTNPFLHMGLHLAIRDQVATNRPAGVSNIYKVLVNRSGDTHTAEHKMIECLAVALWNAQRSNTPPNEQTYLENLQRIR